MTLVVTVEERPIVKDVDFTGNKKLSTSQIKDRLKENKVTVRAGAPLSLRDVARARSTIAEYYVEQGFRSASVDYRIEDISKTEKKVVFLIDEGDKVKIESISFTGNPAVSAQALRNAMKKTKVATFWRILSDDTVYNQANYEADVESIKGLYQSKGYKDVVVKDPILDVYIVNPTAKPTKLKRRVRITIPIVQGEQVLHEQHHHRPCAAERPARRPARAGRLSGPAAAQAVLGASARVDPEPRPPARGHGERSRTCTRRGGTSTGSPTRSSRRSARTAWTSRSEDLRGRQVSTSAASRSRATRRRATRSSAASSASTKAT